MPEQNIKNIPRDKSLADLEGHVLITCGTKETVVSAPASRPTVSIEKQRTGIKVVYLVIV